MIASLPVAVRRIKAIWLPALVFCLTLLGPALLPGGGEAYAQAPVCQVEAKCPELTTGSVITKAMVCIRQAVSSATTCFHAKLLDHLHGAIMAVLALAVTLFGVRLLTGHVQHLVAEAATLLVKMSVVLTMTFAFAYYYPAFFGVIDFANDIIQSTIGHIDGCDAARYNPKPDDAIATTSGTVDLTIGNFTQKIKARDMMMWIKLDCVFDRFFSFSLVKTAAVGVTSLVVLFAAMFIPPFPLGLVLLMMALSAALSFFFMAVRAILIVLLSYLSIGFLIIISPIVVPTLMFKETTSYFQKWIYLVLSSIIQPIFVLAFMGFAAVTITSLAYDGTYTDGDGVAHAMWGDSVSPNTVKPLGQICLPDLTNPDNWKPGSFRLAQITGDPKIFTDMLEKYNVPPDTIKGVESCLEHPGDCTSYVGKKVFNAGAGTLATMALNFNFPVIYPLISVADVKQLFVTLATMLIISLLITKLLFVVPQMASEITGTAGLALINQAYAGLPMLNPQAIAHPIAALKGQVSIIKELNLEKAAAGGLGAVDKALRQGAAKRKTMSGQFVKRGISGALVGGYSGYKAGREQSVMRGVVGAMTGSLAGGLRGARRGAGVGFKSNIRTMGTVARTSISSGFKQFFIKGIGSDGE